MHCLRRFLPFPGRIVCAVALSASALTPQTSDWSPDFATAGLGGRTFAAATYNAELYAGGWWFAAKRGVIHGLARFDGSEWRPVSTGIDLIGSWPPFPEPHVRAMAVYNGELVFAGIFDRAGGQSIEGIARWNGSVIRPLGSGLHLTFGSAEIRALAVFNNELYAAGQFDVAGGTPVDGIARWDGSTWRAVGGGLRQNSGMSVGFPYAMCTHAGRLYVGGEFDRAGGLPVQHIAAWDGSSWSAVGSGSAFAVNALTEYGTELVAAAQFVFGVNVEMLAAWNGVSWHPLGTGGPDLPVMAVRAIGTDLYAGGHFTSPGPYFARFDGTSWSNVGGLQGVFSGITTTTVFGLHEHQQRLIVLGEFTTAGLHPGDVGSVRSANVASFDGTTWRGIGSGLGADRPARRMLWWRGRLIAAGGFTEIGDVRSIGLAAFDGDRWSPLAVLDGDVSDAAVHQGDLIVSGTFSHIDGLPFAGIARFDGTTWHAFGTAAPPGLQAHGSDLYGFGAGSGLLRWSGSTFVTVALAGQPVSHLHSHVDGRLYVSTDTAFTHTIHAWNGTQIQTIGTANDLVMCIGSFGNDLLVGGRLTSVSGVSAQLLARWNGSSWSAMSSPVSGFSVDAVTESEGSLYVGVNGDPRGYCLRWTGSTWQSLGTGINGVPQVFLSDPATGCLWMSGVTLLAGGMPSLSFAQWRTQPAWTDRLRGLGGASGIPLLRGNGTLLVGSTATFSIRGPAYTPLALVLGAARGDLPLFGGTLVPRADAIAGLTTSAGGTSTFALTVPSGLPVGVRLFSQAWLVDPTGPAGLTATNALECATR